MLTVFDGPCAVLLVLAEVVVFFEGSRAMLVDLEGSRAVLEALEGSCTVLLAFEVVPETSRAVLVAFEGFCAVLVVFEASRVVVIVFEGSRAVLLAFEGSPAVLAVFEDFPTLFFLPGLLGLSTVFFWMWGESVGVSLGDDPLVVLPELLLFRPATSSGGTSRGSEEEGRWVTDSATTGESSDKHMSPSWEQKVGDCSKKVAIPPAPSIKIFFSSGRRERLSLIVGSVGFRGPWVLNISAKNLFPRPPTTITMHAYTELHVNMNLKLRACALLIHVLNKKGL